MPDSLTTEDKIRQFRESQFEELGFRRSEAKRLAASKAANGYPLDIHTVRRCIKNGCTHMQAYRIFNDE